MYTQGGDNFDHFGNCETCDNPVNVVMLLLNMVIQTCLFQKIQ